MRFSRRGGYKMGKRPAWGGHPRIRVGTDEEQRAVIDKRLTYSLAARLAQVKWHELPLARLKRVSQALEDPIAES